MAKHVLCAFAVVFLTLASAGCSAPLSTREKGGLIGVGVGAGTGAAVGSTVGRAAAGAAIGGPLGLIGGVLIGDQLMAPKQSQGKKQP